MDIKLLASDMDGTLLQNGAKRPTKEAFELIHQLKENRIVFVAASGRQYHSLRELFAPIADEIAYVCENGCLAVYQDEILYQAKLPDEIAREIFETVESNPRYIALPGGANAAYLLRKEGREKIEDLMLNYFKYNMEWIDDFSDIPEDTIKVAVYCPDGVKKEDVEFFEEKFGDVASVATSGTVWIDLMPKNITKKVGLEKLAARLDISIEDCMAVGDEYNDYEMLSTVGHPVAMDNARTGIRKICPQQTDTVENLMKTLL
ncbi:MAG: HAD family hydrolase [Lachnospiraceae bacterium]